jgi:predicted HTH domain antitoxin
MTKISIDIADDVVRNDYQSPEAFACALRLAALHWYRRGEISHGRAAEIAGLSRAEFIDALAAAGEEAYHLTIDDIRHDIQVLETLNRHMAPA